MNKILTLTVFIGFISISIFGLILMPHSGSHHNLSCLASVVNNSESPCPKGDPFGFASFHNSAVKKISNFTISESITLLYSIIYAFLLLSLVFLLSADKFLTERIKFTVLVLPIIDYRLLVTRDWLSLHENSPSCI